MAESVRKHEAELSGRDLADCRGVFRKSMWNLPRRLRATWQKLRSKQAAFHHPYAISHETSAMSRAAS
jgi:hypothetical protein